jgi:hypothetical protein
MLDDALMKDIDIAYEEFIGTATGKLCAEMQYQSTTAIQFCKFYVKSRGLIK